jgi:surface carbohydrate biosynthesis protein
VKSISKKFLEIIKSKKKEGSTYERKRINLFLPIEVKPREFNSKLFLSAIAAKNGFRCYIGSKPAINKTLNFKNTSAGIYFSNNSKTERELDYYKNKANKYLILDEELSPERKEYTEILAERIWPGSESRIDRYYVVGLNAYKAAKKHFGSMDTVVRLTGWPRVDLWRKNFKKIYSKETNEIKNKYGNFILFSSDFNWISKKKINDTIELYKNYGWESLKEWVKNEDFENTFNEFQIFIKIFKILDDDNSCPLIIIRPHPNDDLVEWERIANLFKRIKVIYKGDISPWMYASSALLHRGCTTGIQAYMAGIPTGYVVTKEEWIRNNTTYDLSEKLYGNQELIKFCKKAIISKPLVPESYSKEFNNQLHVNKLLAVEYIVKDMLTLGVKSEKMIYINILDIIINELKKIIRSALNKINKIIKMNNEEHSIGIAPKEQKMQGGIRIREIKEYLKRLDPNTKYFVKHVIDDCVMIER